MSEHSCKLFESDCVQDLVHYSLSPSLTDVVKSVYGTEFRQSIQETSNKEIFIDFFHGTEDTQQSKQWLTNFGRWCCQERLSADERLLIAVTTMVERALTWCREFQLECATYKEFCFLFAETFIGKICLWGGTLFFICNKLDLWTVQNSEQTEISSIP